MRRVWFLPVHERPLRIAEESVRAVDVDSAGVSVPLEGVIVSAGYRQHVTLADLTRPSSPAVFTGHDSRTSSSSSTTNSGISPVNRKYQ